MIDYTEILTRIENQNKQIISNQEEFLRFPQPGEVIVTSKRLAQILDCSVDTIHEMKAKGVITAHKPGNLIFHLETVYQDLMNAGPTFTAKWRLQERMNKITYKRKL